MRDAVVRVPPLFSGASTTTTTFEGPAMALLRAGNLQASGASPKEYSEAGAPRASTRRKRSRLDLG
jgi:hypothetical protein